MFSWVVKVVPQPAETPGANEAVKTAVAEPIKTKEAKSAPVKTAEEVSEEGQNNTGVIGWLSNGFVSALPQPPGSPLVNRVNSEVKSVENGERSGVIGWVTQGLTKVLPQPDEKYKEANDTHDNNEEHTEVYDVATMPDFDPLPHIPVVEVVSDDEGPDVGSLTPQFPPKVVKWIKQIIPQPVTLPPGAVPTEPPPKASRSSLDKILSPPPESLSGISLDTDSKASGVVNWFVSGLGLKMPQLITPAKDDAEGATEVLQKASSKLQPDMVLEDVESDNEGQQKYENHINVSASSKSLSPHPVMAQQEKAPHTQSNSVQCLDQTQTSECVTRASQEDAETQTGRWTPFIESIKKEAEDVAMATMEERLLQERMEMTRLAEEVARQTAEMAVRQMASEGTSIKLSLESQELLEEPEEEEEEAVPQDQQKVETEEPDPKQEEAPKGTSSSPPPSSEKASEPESEPEPEPELEPVTKTQEANSEAQPVTQQPQKTEDGPVSNTGKAAEKEEEADGDGCGESSSLSHRPAVNVEDVDHEKAEGSEQKSDASQVLNPQDPKLTTLTVPVTPSGGRQSKGDKE